MPNNKKFIIRNLEEIIILNDMQWVSAVDLYDELRNFRKTRNDSRRVGVPVRITPRAISNIIKRYKLKEMDVVPKLYLCEAEKIIKYRKNKLNKLIEKAKITKS
jgi:hypothetical protein